MLPLFRVSFHALFPCFIKYLKFYLDIVCILYDCVIHTSFADFNLARVFCGRQLHSVICFSPVWRLVWGCWIYLQVKELQTVQLVEEVVGESGQLAAMHVQALQLLQAPECPTFQSLQWVIAQIELLQHPEVTEGSTLDPCDVVAIQPKHLHRK